MQQEQEQEKKEVDYGYEAIEDTEYVLPDVRTFGEKVIMAMCENLSDAKIVLAFIKLKKLMKAHNEEADNYLVLVLSIHKSDCYPTKLIKHKRFISANEIYFNIDKFEPILQDNQQLFHDYLGIE